MSEPFDHGAGGGRAEPVAWHYDGRNANRRYPVIEFDALGLTLIGDDWQNGPHPWTALVAMAGTGARSVYGLKTETGWRLGFDGPPPARIAPYLPQPGRYGRWIDKLGLAPALAGFSAISAAVIFVALQVPAWIAPHVPLAWENRLGDAMVRDLDRQYCHTPAGDAALRALAAKMGAGVAVRSVEVADFPLVNAITLPGGRIIIFDGLLQQAQSADEVAGVLGHEMGHVEHRDTLKAMIRQMGLKVVMGGFDGKVGNYVNGVLNLSYSRSAESEADQASVVSLKRANINPSDTAAFFTRLGGGKDTQQAEMAMNWAASHPVSNERRRVFAASQIAGHAYAPAITGPQWESLKYMCEDDPKRAERIRQADQYGD